MEIDENIIYKYEPNSEYYKDKCFLNEDCGDENILTKRKNEFNDNHLSLCEKNCEYIKYDTDTKKVLCKCEIKTEFTKLSELLNNKNNLLYIIHELETDIITNTYENINENSDILKKILFKNFKYHHKFHFCLIFFILMYIFLLKIYNKSILKCHFYGVFSNIISSLTTYITSHITNIYSYTKECLFYERESRECDNLATLKDLFDKNYFPINSKDSIDKVFELFNQEFKNKNINLSNDEIIEGENVVFQMTTTQKQDYYLKNDLHTNISSIDLGE